MSYTININYLLTAFKAAFVGSQGNVADGLFAIAKAIVYFADTVKSINNK